MPTRWSALFFSDDPARRTHLKLTLLATLLMAYCAVLGLYAAMIAGTPARWAWTWALVSLAGQTVTYLAIRSGLTQSLHDPGLTVWQMLFAITSGAVAYALTGPLRAAAFPVLMVVMIFGMFSLSARTVSLVAGYAVVLFAVVMFTMSMLSPQVYPSAVELGHFLMFAVMVPVVPVLALRFGELRARQERQRHDLLRVQALASRDELTGLVNRREMTLLLQRAQAAQARTGRPYCVAVIDLDHFKRINDMYGHGTGDGVLERFAAQGQAVLRDHDTLARWGGEEFVVLLSDSRLAAARAGVERLRDHIAAHSMVIGPHTVSITLSAGVAEPAEGESFEKALSRADHALYVAKARGRNAVVTA